MSGHGVPWIKAKVDTGARTSSLHAFDLEEVVVLTLPVHDRRSVRSSSGHAEDRIVVLMRLTLARRRITAEVTLTDRDEMGFRMLVGRQALEQAFLVDSRLSYAGGRPARATRRKNWGRA